MNALELAIAAPFIIWVLVFLSLGPGSYSMDQNGKEGTFYPLLILYSVFFYVVAGLGLFGSIWAYGALGNLWPSSVLLVAAAEAMLFNGALLFFYEGYLHEKTSYTRARYAAVLALGISAVLMLLVGAVMVATELPA
jgi:hypothetical protein